MDMNVVLKVLVTVLCVLFGGLAAWFRTNTKLRDKAKELIDEAEGMYLDTVKAGGRRFAWVVDTLMDLIPAALKPFITRAMVEKIVQGIFDAMQSFAKKVLDEAANKYTE